MFGQAAMIRNFLSFAQDLYLVVIGVQKSGAGSNIEYMLLGQEG